MTISKIFSILSRCAPYAFAAAWAVLTLYPLVFSLLSSFKENRDIFGRPFALPDSIHFEYYAAAFQKAHMGTAIVNSLWITSSVTLCTVVLSLLAAYALSRMKLAYADFITVYMVAGLMIPVHSVLIPLVRLFSSLGGQNNRTLLILLYTAFALPLSIFLMVGYMKSISRELEEAAHIDGCGPTKTLFMVLLPVAMPVVATAGIITFLFTYNDLLFAVMFITERSMYTVSLGLMSFVGYRSTDYGPTFAATILSVVPMLVVYLLFQEKVERGLSAGAVKG